MPELNPSFPHTPHAVFALDSPEDTLRLGRCLAEALSETNPGAILLFGTLGAGKTTLCRALVSALPGGDTAEVASPSFTICNIYSTEPAVHHFDLYRLQPGMPDESLEESLDRDNILTLVEWSEHLLQRDYPRDGAALRLSGGEKENRRRAEFFSLGPLGDRFWARVLAHCPQFHTHLP